MTTKLAHMAEVLSRSPSTRNIGTMTELSHNVAARVTKTAVSGGGRQRRGKSWCSGRRKAKGIKGPRVVTPIVRIRGRCLVPRPGNAVPIRGSGSKRFSVPFKVGSRPGLRGVAVPLLADLIEIRRLMTMNCCGFC